MKYIINIDDVPPNLNAIIFKAKRHWGIYASMKKAWKNTVNKSIDQKWVPFFKPVTISITYFFEDKRTRDIDNYTAKFIMDGLTKKDNPDKYLIQDDSEKFVTDVHIRLRKNTIRHTVIEITDELWEGKNER